MHDRPPSDAGHKREQKRARDRRRYRREISGRRIAPTEYFAEMVDYLVKYEWIRKGENRDDPRVIGDAIGRLMRDAVENDPE